MTDNKLIKFIIPKDSYSFIFSPVVIFLKNKKIVSEQAMTNVKYEIRSDVLYNKLNKSLNADTNIKYEIIHDEIARAKK